MHVPWRHELSEAEIASLFRVAKNVAEKTTNALAPDFVCVLHLWQENTSYLNSTLGSNGVHKNPTRILETRSFRPLMVANTPWPVPRVLIQDMFIEEIYFFAVFLSFITQRGPLR